MGDGRNQKPGAGAVGPVLRGCVAEIERLRAQVEKLTKDSEALHQRYISALDAAWQLGESLAAALAGLPYAPTHGCFYSDSWHEQVVAAVTQLRQERDALLAAKGELVEVLRSIESEAQDFVNDWAADAQEGGRPCGKYLDRWSAVLSALAKHGGGA